ncbi:MAG: hypothetical protein D6677_11535 [Calditrichaeota bacterium]|nr:MAG: hypothetical protein D6677_11535 [Calditrichota bacterium]
MPNQPLNTTRIIRFWWPLAATWLMMAAEGPFVTGIIARMTDATQNLAAFGVAYAFALMSESPVIMLMAAATRWVKDRDSYITLRRFTLLLIAGVTVALLTVLYTPLYDLLIYKLLKLDAPMHDTVRMTLTWMLPWPGAIAWRRFLQGVLIVHGRTRTVSQGTIIRLAGMSGAAILFYHSEILPGSVAGGAALSVGVVMEMAATYLMARPTIRHFYSIKNRSGAPGLPEVIRFYYPLALATFIGLATMPMLTFFIGQSRMALESLALLPVVNAFIFIFRSIGLSFQEVAITFLGHSGERYRWVHRFVIKTAFVITFLVLIIVVTPLISYWYGHINGLSPELAALAIPPTLLLAAGPALTLYISWQRAVEMQTRRTRHVSNATILEVAVIALIMTIGIRIGDWVGITAAAVALMGGRLSGNLYLFWANRSATQVLFDKS